MLFKWKCGVHPHWDTLKWKKNMYYNDNKTNCSRFVRLSECKWVTNGEELLHDGNTLFLLQVAAHFKCSSWAYVEPLLCTDNHKKGGFNSSVTCQKGKPITHPMTESRSNISSSISSSDVFIRSQCSLCLYYICHIIIIVVVIIILCLFGAVIYL